MGRDWVPFDDQNELNTGVDFPEGQSLDRTIAGFTDMAKQVSTIPEVVFVEAYTQGLTYHGHLYISLKDRSQRSRSSAEIGQDVRKVLAPFSKRRNLRSSAFGARRRELRADSRDYSGPRY